MEFKGRTPKVRTLHFRQKILPGEFTSVGHPSRESPFVGTLPLFLLTRRFHMRDQLTGMIKKDGAVNAATLCRVQGVKLQRVEHFQQHDLYMFAAIELRTGRGEVKETRQ